MKRLALLCLLVGCKQIDASKVEDSIKEGLAEKKLIVKSVSCPEGKTLKKGDKFQCTAETDQHLVIDVDQQDDEGSIKWQLQGVILDEKVLGDGLESQIGQGIDVACDAKITVKKVGESFDCATKHPDGKITISVKDEDGHLDYKLSP
jgi:hypothetical protein